MDDIIKESDLIQVDGTIDNLIKQLSELNSSFATIAENVKRSAGNMQKSLKSASGATKEGRRAIDEAVEAADRLTRAENELAFALSETGKQVALLKAETRNVNKATVEQQRQLTLAASSYDKLKTEITELTKLYKSLTAAERDDVNFGEQLISELKEKNAELKKLEQAIKPVVEQMTRLQKAEKELAYWQSEEGRQVLELKAKIRELTAAKKEQKAVTDPLANAEKKLSDLMRGEKDALMETNLEISKQTKLRKLVIKENEAQEGSYAKLSAQYARAKFELEQLNLTLPENTNKISQLKHELNVTYSAMRKFQEQTGVHSLGVGDYKAGFVGLSNSVQQIVRELPAATISLNTFFLAISNNVPIFMDEFKRARLAFEADVEAIKKAAENSTDAANQIGKLDTPIKKVIKSLFSWQTALVLVLTVLPAYGEEILAWVVKLFKGRDAALSFKDALHNIAEELKTTNASYGSNVTAFKQLQSEWSRLESTAEKNQWIADNKTEFENLGFAVHGVADAENIFLDNTPAVIEALQLRAKAAAAQKLASEKYEEALIKRNKAETIEATGPSGWDKISNFFGQASLRSTGPAAANLVLADQLSDEDFKQQRIEKLEAEESAALATADSYFKLAAGYNAAADAALKNAGIDVPHTTDRGAVGRDLTDAINRMSISVKKKYEQSITALERKEYEKRKQEATDAANAKIRELEETYRKNEDYLNDEEHKYKELTDAEKELIKTAQEEIRKTITNTHAQLNRELELIYKDRQISELKLEEETLQLKLGAVKKGSAEELQLRLDAAKKAYAMSLLENSKKPEDERQNYLDMLAKYLKEQSLIIGEFEMQVFEQQQDLDKALFDETKHNQTQITRFELQQEKERWEKQIALAKSGGLDWSEAQIAAAESAIRGIDRELSELNFIANVGKKGLGVSLLEAIGLDDDQIDALSDAANIVIEQLQEIMDAEVALAEQAVENAQMRTDAAKSAYEAEVEARNKGYANNVATAKKELEQEKKNQMLKQKQLEAAQRRQEALNSVLQASSLVTASANLWSSFSSVPIVGPALALAAIATMWSSFAVAKIKARQVTAASDEYGEGGLEFLEGGSHASGNDIDLGTHNRRGRRMKAEGGEALAIINKRQTKKYRKVLPDVIDSFNKGTFEDKYLKAFSSSDGMSITLNSSNNVDLTRIERDVRSIKQQNETRYFTTPDGFTIMQRKNVKRIIKS